MVYVVLVLAWAFLGLVLGVMENYMRDEPIPSLHILAVGVSGAILGGLIVLVAAGFTSLYARNYSFYVAGFMGFVFLRIDRLICEGRSSL